MHQKKTISSFPIGKPMAGPSKALPFAGGFCLHLGFILKTTSKTTHEILLPHLSRACGVSCKCVILSQISFQFLPSSAIIASAQRPNAQRMNWKKTAAKEWPVYPDLIDAWGSGIKLAMPKQFSAPAIPNHCVKLPRMPNAMMWMIVLLVAVTLTCATQAHLCPSACCWWPFALP